MLLTLVGCSSSGYDSDVQERFLNACKGKGSTSAFCECKLDVFEKRHNQTELTQLELVMTQTQSIPPAIQQTLQVVSTECRP